MYIMNLLIGGHVNAFTSRIRWSGAPDGLSGCFV